MNTKKGGHKASLREQHAVLEAELKDERSRPIPCQARLQELRRKKLRLKDQIEGIGVTRPQPSAAAETIAEIHQFPIHSEVEIDNPEQRIATA